MKTENSFGKHRATVPVRSVFALAACITLFHHNVSAFCGFYVAKADASLFNHTSQVLLVRNGDRTTITMSSDFEGSIQDFAMVVPVPVVLQQKDIRTVADDLFAKLDNYSSPRLVEYWDENPCYVREVEDSYAFPAEMKMSSRSEQSPNNAESQYQVKIEARYTVDEYDILILSAQESGGLERWLTDNGYKIPAGAQEVLRPYIQSQMKFFVVKVNAENLAKKGTQLLSPLQISFNSPKFMLPIRLGMANARGEQDMIVYAISPKGRVETTNYRTVSVPTNSKIPEFIKDDFGKFYVDTYRKHRTEAGRGNVYLEYAWNISGFITMKCDPCNGPPPLMQDLLTAGVDWLQQNQNNYSGNVFFTRLHVTYDRRSFPQDLVLEETPNRENFQARYVITHPATGPLECDAGRNYAKSLKERRKEELNNLAILTGWDVSGYAGYLTNYNGYVPDPEPKNKKQLPGKSDHSVPGKTDMDKAVDVDRDVDTASAKALISPAPPADFHDEGGETSPWTVLAGTLLLCLLYVIYILRSSRQKTAVIQTK